MYFSETSRREVAYTRREVTSTKSEGWVAPTKGSASADEGNRCSDKDSATHNAPPPERVYVSEGDSDSEPNLVTGPALETLYNVRTNVTELYGYLSDPRSLAHLSHIFCFLFTYTNE